MKIQQKKKNNFEKQKPCKKKNQKDVAQASDLFYFFFNFCPKYR